MQRLRDLIEKVALSNLSIAIQGPTGAGKEVVANAIHQASRRTGKFVAFNVSGISEGLFEDALFGHIRGGFTNALADRDGYLMEAHNGTLFMDEIGQLRLSNQSTLLRAIDMKVFRPVGGKRDKTSDFRIISATNEDLPMLSVHGQFRVDLLHRLRSFVITVPPLTQHIEDIPSLTAHLLGQVFGERREVSVTREAMCRLQEYHWPGNVRELRSVIQAAFYLANEESITANAVEMALAAGAGDVLGDFTVHQQRREVLVKALVRHQHRVESVATDLGVARATVYRWLKYYGIPTPERYRPTKLDSGQLLGQ